MSSNSYICNIEAKSDSIISEKIGKLSEDTLSNIDNNLLPNNNYSNNEEFNDYYDNFYN